MAKWASNLAVFVGATALGWYLTKLVDYLAQTPMLPSPSDALRHDPERLAVALQVVDGHIKSATEGRPFWRQGVTMENVRIAWSKIEPQIQIAEAVAIDIAEKSIPQLPEDMQRRAVIEVKSAWIPLLLLTDGGAPNGNLIKIMAHWSAAWQAIGALTQELEFYINQQIPENQGLFKARMGDLLRPFYDIKIVAAQLIGTN